MVSSIIFLVVLAITVVLFYRSVNVIIQNIKLGKPLDIKDQQQKRWKTMFLVAIGQSKMVKRPIAGILHILVYTGFIMVNFEMLEIMTDGIAGTHRVFSFLPFYNVLISVFEVFALAVITACVVFLFRRNGLRLARFHKPEMTSWPKLDGNIILITEILLMTALFSMNAADQVLQLKGVEHYPVTGTFLISGFLVPLFSGFSVSTLEFIEGFGWWFHIIGVFAFLNYIPYSKHFHVFLVFPNVYFSKLKPATYISNMEAVTTEVKIAMGIISEEEAGTEEVERFGAKDVRDLSWKSLADAYTCTECGRCTDVCPANKTGKMLSPRKIIMDTRDRLEIVGKGVAKDGNSFDDNKALWGDFISPEELWACTTCNACTNECPVNIDHVSIIMELRRYSSLEEASTPPTLNSALTNIENNGAPWQYSQDDRMLWADGVNVPLMADMFAAGKKPEYLFWVSSAGAFDDRYKKVVRSFVKILNHLKVDFAVLGTEESDSGDLARRAGNEMLYQMQALMNIEVLNGYEVKKIVCTDPHDFNTLKNEYPDLGGNFEVIHHTQFLQEQIAAGNLEIGGDVFEGSTITYHDPCYLGRGNGEYDAPRDVLAAIPSVKVEMKDNRASSLCCGAGGGQMFKEAENGDKEIFMERTEQALETGCNIVATACPFCMAMISDGLKYKEKEETVKNYDIAELVAMSMKL
ncbi:MAG: (Fe-S)-binding protein [Bacteroidales bacterium]|nr:(Fe-S)-binding protein [Bacteroidales bacterium]